jgi:ribosomal protein S18 acetylase RimI-like enzyme
MEKGTERLSPMHITLRSVPFNSIARWPFSEPFVTRVLLSDIPQRVKINGCRLLGFRDAAHEIVGFGTIERCRDYAYLTGGRAHPYIPLLAVHPDKQGRGYGTMILNELINMAIWLARDVSTNCADLLFLDVYESSCAAIALYSKCGFTKVLDEPQLDPVENKPYFVMARRLALGTLRQGGPQTPVPRP